HAQVLFLDNAVQVGVDEIESRCGAPVTEQPRFDVRQLERLLQQRIVVEINLSDREVVRRAPPGIQLARRFWSLCFHDAIRFHFAPRPRMRQTERAIISSSSVRMMRTLTRPVGAEITGALSALRASFSSMPRKPSPS